MQRSKLRPAAKEPVPSQTPGRIILQGLALINARPCFNVAWDTRGRFPPGAKPPRHRNAQACGRGQSLWAARRVASVVQLRISPVVAARTSR